jgi:cytoskeleton protein RodZ
MTMNEFGELLRQARDFKGVTLREAERATRISRAYLTALESEDFDQLPPAAYARGIVRNYAQYLGLDPVSTLSLYERSTGGAAGSASVVPATRPLDSSSHWAPNFAIIAFMVVMSAVVFAWMYSAYFQRPDALATTTVGVATVTAVPDSILALADDQATVATQGGGIATTTPTATATATPEPPVQQAAVEIAPTESVEAAVVEEPVDETAPEDEVAVEEETVSDTADPIGTGAHTFVIYTSEDVWVQVILDGEAVFDDVLPAGAERIYYADAAAITSGNAALVEVYVDGDPYGTLGESWDATFYYP